MRGDGGRVWWCEPRRQRTARSAKSYNNDTILVTGTRPTRHRRRRRRPSHLYTIPNRPNPSLLLLPEDGVVLIPEVEDGAGEAVAREVEAQQTTTASHGHFPSTHSHLYGVRIPVGKANDRAT
jgi:hypothetical protein